MKYKLALLIIGFLFLNCSVKQKTTSTTPITIVNEFDYDAVSWFKTKGTGKIKGVDKFKSKSGTILFGEDYRIELMPNCKYTEERLSKIYTNKESGYVHIEDGIPKFTPDPEGYHDTLKTMCTKEGAFEFSNLPPGDYYIIAFMISEKTGGGIMQHLILSDNETKAIEMINF